MRRLLPVAVLTLAFAAATSPALAKGPTGATITGPGIAEPIVIEGYGEYGAGGEFSELVTAAGFWPLVGGVGTMHSAQGRVIAGPPPGDLGDAYLIEFHLGDQVAATFVYPAAPGGTLVHVDADEVAAAFGDTAPGGWFVAPSSLLDLLAGYGVPVKGANAVIAEPTHSATITTVVEKAAAGDADTPTAAAQPVADGGPGALALGAAAVIIAASLMWAVGRRPRRAGAP